MSAMIIELTSKQQDALDREDHEPQRVLDPRTQTAYVLVPEGEYDSIQELLEDEQREAALHAVALQNAARRLD